MTEEKTFGDWVKEQREAQNMRPADLARAAGLSRGYLHIIENNIAHGTSGAPPKPSVELVDRIARALGLSPTAGRRAAKLIPAEIPISEVKTQELLEYFQVLPDDKQDEALQHLRFLYQKFGDKSRMLELFPKHPAVVKEGEVAPPPIAATTPVLPTSRTKKDSAKTHVESPAKKAGNDK